MCLSAHTVRKHEKVAATFPPSPGPPVLTLGRFIATCEVRDSSALAFASKLSFADYLLALVPPVAWFCLLRTVLAAGTHIARS